MDRPALLAVALCASLLFGGCKKPAPVNPPPAAALRDEIPPEKLREVLDAHYQGLGAMERYEYNDAIKAFRQVHKLAPGWIPGSINLALALLNEGGEVAEESGNPDQAKTQGVTRNNLDEAVTLLDGVLARDPRHPSALFCKGIIRQFQGELAEAHKLYGQVLDVDPTDAHAWLERGATLTDPAEPDLPAGADQAPALIGFYTKALERNPYLVQALFKLQAAYGLAGDADQRDKLMALWMQLNPKMNAAGSGDSAANVYGEMGKHARILNPLPTTPRASTPAPAAPRFAPPETLTVALPSGDRWATPADFSGKNQALGRARARFGAAVIPFDANGDGRLDLFLPASVVGPSGLRDALLIRRPEGQGDGFEDQTARFGLPTDRASLGAAAADFDADRRIDLFVFGVGDQRLLRNTGSKFDDVTDAAKVDRHQAIVVGARWLDLDQDGDLDLYVVNHAPASASEIVFTGKPVPGLVNSAYRNDGQPGPIPNRPADNFAPVAVATSDLPATEGLSVAFSESWPGVEPLRGGEANHVAVASLDADEDRDLDLVLAADGQPTQFVWNDRGGAFHRNDDATIAPSRPIDGLLTVDLDKDGRVDLVSTDHAGRLAAWRNTVVSGSVRWVEAPSAGRNWSGATVADLDLDTNPDLVGSASQPAPGTVEWARWTGSNLAATKLALGPDVRAGVGVAGLAVADLAGDLLPDLLLVSGDGPPRLARNLGNGSNWVALELSGRWKTSFDQMRTNPHGIGTRLALEGQGIAAPFDYVTPTAGPSQTVGPIVLGLGSALSAPLLRLRWPDGVMQCELNVTANKRLEVAEVSRKTGSCPVLFTWNGTRFECLGDFLGGGGLGYLVAPGVYSQPDRDEAVLIRSDQLQPRNGRLALSVVEPMDEVAYLDQLHLDVIDAPPGIDVVLDERFAPEGPRPSGQAWAVAQRVEPIRVTDHRGRDITERLQQWDRRTADGFARLNGWVGYAAEHSITLDFGDRLRDLAPNTPLVLSLTGWVEYPYSQTNYAAATAGVTLRPPTLERQRPDGSWEEISPSMGYPAGLPRAMTVDLTGRCGGDRCVLRIRTNMECYWDQAEIRVRPSTDPGLVTTTLAVDRATLGDKGYLREVSPDGGIPLVYDYDHPDPAPLARMAGRLTRHGDVRSLVVTDDDRFCTVGPGDEVKLEFDPAGLPLLKPGWTRRYVLRAFGYCKDADPYTATSDTVEPLPWQGMPSYPFATPTTRPADAGFEDYLRTYQTRPAGSR